MRLRLSIMPVGARLSLLDRWRSWRATPVQMRRLLVEATLELLRARLLVDFGLRRALPGLLAPRNTDDPVPPEQMQRDIRYIVWLASSSVPWRSLCLPNAIAARRMLARRGFPSTLHLGVGHHEAGDPHAHAWLEAGSIITGAEGMETVTPLPHPGARVGRA